MIYDKRNRRERLKIITIGLAVLSLLIAWGHVEILYHRYFWYKSAQKMEVEHINILNNVKNTSRGDIKESKVIYTFLVDGKQYDGQAEYGPFESFTNTTTVYYDPRDPSINSLRDPGIKLIIISGYALLLVLVGFLISFFTLFERQNLKKVSVGALKILVFPLWIPLLIVLYKPRRRR